MEGSESALSSAGASFGSSFARAMRSGTAGAASAGFSAASSASRALRSAIVHTV